MNYLSANLQNALSELGFTTPQDIANAGAVKVFLLLKEWGLTPTNPYYGVWTLLHEISLYLKLTINANKNFQAA